MPRSVQLHPGAVLRVHMLMSRGGLMTIRKTYACGRCGDDVDPKTARQMGGRYWHYECPEQAFDRIMRELKEEQ